MMNFKLTTAWSAALVAVSLSSCSGCGDDGNQDTDTGLDTDTSWDGGPLTDCDDALPHANMVCVPGGRYLMGCMPYDTQCEENEKPMVVVTLSPFWIDEKEATIEELLPFLNSLQEGYLRGPFYLYEGTEDAGLGEELWESMGSPICLDEETGEYEYSTVCMGNDQCGNRSEEAAAGGLGWLGAKMYCEYRGKRLPTEAEWEAAARGQTKWIYPCAWEHKDCWYGVYDCCGYESEAECYSGACQDHCCIPFEDTITNCPSPFGVKEVYGNAAEWVMDHEDADHSWCASGCTDPPPRKGEGPIPKGGGVGSNADYTRVSHRFGAEGTPGPYSGVRCVSSPVDFVLSDGGVVWGE